MAQVCKIIIITTAVLVSSLTAQDIITKPDNATVVKGSELTLICEVSRPSEAIFIWKEFITNQVGESIFLVTPDDYPDGSLHDPNKYEIRDTFNLHFKDIDTVDGGRYSCEVIGGSQSQVEIIVLDQPRMMIPDMIDGERIEMSCSINYGGPRTDETPEDHIPHLRMELDGSVIEAVEERTEGRPGSEYQEHAIKLTLNTTANAAYNGLNLTCIASTAKPAYELKVSEMVDVKYKVRNIATAPQNDFFYVGEMLNCSASGNPEPSFRWLPIKSNGPITVDGPVLIINDRMAGIRNEWRCQATNNVHTIESIEIEVDFDIVQHEGPGGSAARFKLQSSSFVCLLTLTWLLK